MLLTLYLERLRDEKLILFPPPGLYVVMVWCDLGQISGGAVAITLELAFVSVAGSLLIGVPAGIALSRYRFPPLGSGVLECVVAMAPLTVPGIALGLAIYLFLVLIEIHTGVAIVRVDALRSRPGPSS